MAVTTVLMSKQAEACARQARNGKGSERCGSEGLYIIQYKAARRWRIIAFSLRLIFAFSKLYVRQYPSPTLYHQLVASPPHIDDLELRILLEVFA